jgi:hypothetical protein
MFFMKKHNKHLRRREKTENAVKERGLKRRLPLKKRILSQARRGVGSRLAFLKKLLYIHDSRFPKSGRNLRTGGIEQAGGVQINQIPC